MKTVEHGIRNILGAVFPCRSYTHAVGMMRSTSVVIGPMEGREIVRREVSQWEVVE